MIKVYFPPGCYGTYFARCLYNYTSLRLDEFVLPTFDIDGSSHDHRNDHTAWSMVQCLHFDKELLVDDSYKLVILPLQSHYLDYYNNQFVKQGKNQLVSYVHSQLSAEEIIKKLKDGWNYDQPFDNLTPTWILREFFSFWITDCLNDGYSASNYNHIIADTIIDTQDIFLNFEKTFERICSTMNLKINIKYDLINTVHQEFLNKQRFHLSQLRCQQWVYDAINERLNTLNPCQTIFDESYVQHLLRELGYELLCDGLDTFPKTSKDLRKIIVK